MVHKVVSFAVLWGGGGIPLPHFSTRIYATDKCCYLIILFFGPFTSEAYSCFECHVIDIFDILSIVFITHCTNELYLLRKLMST